jgi:hypothetical protein
VQERADEVGLLDRLVGQVVLQPGRNTLEVLVSFGEHPGLHHHLPQMLKSSTRRQFVQQVVTDRAAFGDERCQQSGVRMLVNPLDGLERRMSAGEAVRERLELSWNGPVRSGEQVVDLVGEDAVGATPVPVRVPRPSALPAAVVDVMPRAGTAEPGSAGVPGDERVEFVAAGALGWGPDDGGVAALTDRSDRPVGHDGLVALAASAGHAGTLVAGVAGVADRLAGGDPLARPYPSAT